MKPQTTNSRLAALLPLRTEKQLRDLEQLVFEEYDVLTDAELVRIRDAANQRGNDAEDADEYQYAMRIWDIADCCSDEMRRRAESDGSVWDLPIVRSR